MIDISGVNFNYGKLSFSVINQFDGLLEYSISMRFDPSEVDLASLMVTGSKGLGVDLINDFSIGDGWWFREFDSEGWKIAYAYKSNSGELEFGAFALNDIPILPGKALINLSIDLNSYTDTSVPLLMFASVSSATSYLEIAQKSIILQSSTNHYPTGNVWITLPENTVPYVGQTLLAENTLADPDGVGDIIYSWLADNLTVAIGPTYTLKQSELGKAISVVARYTDGQGNAEAVTSEPTAKVELFNNPPAGSVEISGVPTQRETLTASNSVTDADGIGAITYTWQSNGATIGTGTTYTLTQAEVGNTITVTASYTDGNSNVESVKSAPTSSVANINDAPTGSVTIAGTAALDQTLTASNTLADPDGLGAITYTWKAVNLILGTGATYTLTSADVGKAITVTADYIDGGSTFESVTSEQTAVVTLNRMPSGTVSISGTPTQGQTLTASNNLSDPDGLGNITYTWKANGTTLTTGNKLKLLQAEVGKNITVTASYTDAGGTQESVTSVATATVANINDAPVMTPRAPTLNQITEDDIDNAGQTVASVLESSLKDIDADAKQGIAITATTGGNGAWQFSVDAGITWSNVGTVSTSAALLLRDVDMVRWQPDGKFGTTATIEYFGWDQTAGTPASKVEIVGEGGTFAFSSSSDLLTAIVANVNDSPEWIAGSGAVNTNIGLHARPLDIALQSDGKIIVAGYSYDGVKNNYALARYFPDGDLDPSFSNSPNALNTQIGGIVTTSFGSGDSNGQKVAIQSDGKIIFAGYTYNGKDYDFSVARYNKNGTLDSSFDGDGKATASFGSGYDYAFDVAIQNDGKILLGGTSQNSFALLRYHPSGILDTSFGTSGKVMTSIGSSDTGRSISLQPDGKILMGGWTNSGANLDFALARYNQNGTLDTTFGFGGKVITDFGYRDAAYDIIVQADGKIIAAGMSEANGRDFSIARYNTDGSLDQSFGMGGKVLTNLVGDQIARSVIALPDGKILVAGDRIARYLPNGEIDKSFGTDGVGYGFSTAATSDHSGRIFTVDQASGNFSNSGFLVSSFEENWKVDQSFGGNGKPDDVSIFSENGSIIILDEDVAVYDFELDSEGNYSGSSIMLTRVGSESEEDVFLAGSEFLAPLTEGEILEISGIDIGTVTKNSGGVLALTFNNKATQALVSKALQSIAYVNVSDAPPASVQVEWIFNDGNVGAQGSGDSLVATGITTIYITPVEDEAVGSLYITGAPESGGILTANIIADDPDGHIVDIAFQWQELEHSNWVELLRNDASNIAITIPSDDSLLGKKLRVIATTTDALGGSTDFISSAIEVGLPRVAIDTKVTLWNSKYPIAGVDISIEDQTMETDSLGLSRFTSIPNTSVSVSASVTPYSEAQIDSAAAVTLQDAVGILKMITGQSLNGEGVPTPRAQSLAADFDGSGMVSLADAIGVLRHAVGLQAPAPSWVFIEEGDNTGPSALNPGIPGPVTVDVTPPGPIEVNLIGVLRGDVDGSYGVYPV
jgi:uncharacterized delta-60 repeat protein